jgi:L-ribulose-5-phosphate 3-epimerase
MEQSVQLGYNTNGFAHHRLGDCFDILSSIGYRSVAVTIEHDLLDPPDHTGVASAIACLRELRDRTGVSLTIETGARFILDPTRKHQPTLLSSDPVDRSRRRDFLLAAIDIAAGVDATCVSLWSGKGDDGEDDMTLWTRLENETRLLLDHAESSDVRLAFEPEPDMFIETMNQFSRLHDAMDHPLFGLTLDVGHVHCLSNGDSASYIERWRNKLFNIHIEDMKPGVHEHLMFGDGDMEFAPIFDALRRINYDGSLNVELSRHSHDAVETARRSFEFLRRYAG